MNDAKVITFLNHTLNDKQIEELKERGISEIVQPSDEIKAKFSQVPTDSEISLKLCKDILNEILNSNAETVIIQGEMGHCFAVISELLDRGFTVLHAVSERKTVETIKDGVSVKTAVFEHKCFRPYKKFSTWEFDE